MTELLNLNTANSAELTTLPGVGPAIAARIVAARPFTDTSELQAIEGIGAALFARLTSLVDVGGDVSAPEADSLEEAPTTLEELPAAPTQTDSLEDEPEIPLDGFASEEAAPIPPAPVGKIKPGVTRGQTLMISLISSFVAFILAVALMLGVLVGLNGGLRFVSPTELAQIERQVDGMQAQLDIMTQDMDGLRARINNLEDIGQQVAQLSEDVAVVRDQTEILSGDVEALQADTAQFQNFFEGLRDLMNTLFGADAP